MRQPTDELFSPLEEEFFRAGDAISDSTDDAFLEDAPAPPSFWSRLFSRTPHLSDDPTLGSDDDRDWQLAIARARHATNG